MFLKETWEEYLIIIMESLLISLYLLSFLISLEPHFGDSNLRIKTLCDFQEKNTFFLVSVCHDRLFPPFISRMYAQCFSFLFFFPSLRLQFPKVRNMNCMYLQVICVITLNLPSRKIILFKSALTVCELRALYIILIGEICPSQGLELSVD